MGLHTSEPDVGEERYVGMGVHRAARIGAVGHGGQVLVSGASWEVAHDEPGGGSMRELGRYRLKDIDTPERLFQLDVEGLQQEFPPLRAERAAPPRRVRRAVLLAALIAVVVAAVTVPIVLVGHHHSSGGPFAAAGSDAVDVINPSNGRLTSSIQLPSTPGAITYGAGSIWVTMPNQGSVSRIDPETDTVEQTVAVGDGPQAVVVGDGSVWVANSVAGTVTQIDPRQNGGTAVNQIKVGNGPAGLAVGSGGVWVADAVDHAIVKIDPSTGTPSQPIPVDDGADALAIGDGAIWVLGASAGVVSRVDPVTGGVEDTTNVGNGPVALAVGGGSVWVANAEGGTISRVDAATNQVDGTVTVGAGPSGVSVAPGGHQVWVANGLAGTLSQVSAATAAVGRTVSAHGRPQSVAVGAQGVYVAVAGSGTAHRGGTLTLATAGAADIYTNGGLPNSLDPADGFSSGELLILTNDGLLTYARTGGAASYQVVPDLALTLPSVSDGGRTYTLQLRPGIRYSTGSIVQPADIRRGIERTLELTGKVAPSSDLTGIVGAAVCVRTPQSCDLSSGVVTHQRTNTITFHLTRPDPDFAYKLASPLADAVPASTPLHAKLPLPATGPYDIVNINRKAGTVRLARNAQFRVWSAVAQPAGYPDQIVERFNYTDPGAVAAVEAGTANLTDVAPGLPQSVEARLNTLYLSQLHNAPVLDTVGTWLNTKVPPFNNVLVRRALNYAVDRNRLVALAGGPNVAESSCQILPPNINGYQRYCPYSVDRDSTDAYHGPDVAKAQKLVTRSRTRGEPVTLWFFNIPIGKRNGEYLVSVLRSLGFKARLRTINHLKQTTYRANRQAGVGGTGDDYPSASDIIAPVFTCGSYHPDDPALNGNNSGFCAPRLDAQIRRATLLQGSDAPAASALWSRIDREITDQAPWVVLRNDIAPVFLSARTGNYTFCYVGGIACLDQLWVR
jgi:YVTN family beta-propeller protein